MNEGRVQLPKLHPAQRQIKAAVSRFVVVGCGRRFGKTEVGKDQIIHAVLETPAPYAIVVPTYSDMLKTWDDITSAMHDFIIGKSKSERRIKFIKGATLELYSGDAIDRMRGSAYKGILVDEAAAIADLEYGWTRVMMPTLADMSGWAWFLSSFKGKNYFYTLYHYGLDPLREAWASFSFPTSANPFIDKLEIALAKAELPERAFLEEYMAVPSDDYGAVFRGILDVANFQPQAADKKRRYVMGIDWARSHDFTVIVVMDRDSKRVVAIDRFNQIDWALQRGRVKSLAQQYNADLILAEANSIGEPNIEALRTDGIAVRAFTTTATNKPGLIDDLSLAIENQKIGLLDDSTANGKAMLSELQAYEMTRTAAGNWKYGAPSGGHDDCVIALALAWRAITKNMSIVIRPQPAGLRNYRG